VITTESSVWSMVSSTRVWIQAVNLVQVDVGAEPSERRCMPEGIRRVGGGKGANLTSDQVGWMPRTRPYRPVGPPERGWLAVGLVVGVAVLGGCSALEPPVDLVAVRVSPLAHPVLETR
jgi:hypothetical protein